VAWPGLCRSAGFAQPALTAGRAGACSCLAPSLSGQETRRSGRRRHPVARPDGASLRHRFAAIASTARRGSKFAAGPGLPCGGAARVSRRAERVRAKSTPVAVCLGDAVLADRRRIGL